MKAIYFTVFEGIHNIGIYNSQVIEFIRSLNNRDIETTHIAVVESMNLSKIKKILETSNINFTIFVASKLRTMLFNRKTISSIAKTINSFSDKDTIIICRETLATSIVLSGKKYYKFKHIILDKRGLLVEESRQLTSNIFKRMIRKSYYEILRRYSLRRADYIKVVSTNMMYYLSGKYNIEQRRFFVAPCAVNSFLLKEQRLDNIIKIVYAGSTYKYQNFEKIIHFISELINSGLNIHFTVISNDFIGNKYQEHIDKKNITYLSLSHEDLMNELSNHHFGIVYRDNDIINRVSSPIKITEYLSRGLKIIYAGEIGIIDYLRDINISYENFFVKIETIDSVIRNLTNKINITPAYIPELTFDYQANSLKSFLKGKS